MWERKELFFKASRKNSETFPAYRQIIKRWDMEIDMMKYSDDVIIINKTDIEQTLHIDCDKKTGEFRLFFN